MKGPVGFYMNGSESNNGTQIEKMAYFFKRNQWNTMKKYTKF